MDGHPFRQLLDGQPQLRAEHHLPLLRGAFSPHGVVLPERVAVVDYLHVIRLPGHGDGAERTRAFLDAELHAEDGVRAEHLVQTLDLGEDLLQLLRRVDSEPEDVPAAPVRRVHHQRLTELTVPHADALHLYVGYADVEVFSHVRVPHQPHVGDEERSEVALLAAQVPHPVDLVVHLLLGQQLELLVRDDGTAELEVAVHLGAIVRAVHRLDGVEKPRGVRHEVGEDELEPATVELGHDVQRLGLTPEPRLGGARVDGNHGAVPDAEVDVPPPARHPYRPQVGHHELALVPGVSLCVLHPLEVIDLELALAQVQVLELDVETDLAVLPHRVLADAAHRPSARPCVCSPGARREWNLFILFVTVPQ